jgi:hypothetical protein
MTRTLMGYTITAAVALTLSGTGALAELPDPGMKIDRADTALVVTDPQNDFLSPEGVTWGVVGASVTENGTVENLEVLVVSDGTAAALTNFRFIANAVRTTQQVATELVGAETAQRFINESRGEVR